MTSVMIGMVWLCAWSEKQTPF